MTEANKIGRGGLEALIGKPVRVAFSQGSPRGQVGEYTFTKILPGLDRKFGRSEFARAILSDGAEMVIWPNDDIVAL